MKLVERTGWSKPEIDEEAGVIKGLKILGWSSKNGRKYRRKAVEEAKKFYDGMGVNIDHRDRGDRSVMDGFGKLSNPELREDGLYGDLSFLKSHEYTPRFLETASRMPEQLGLSHIAEGEVASDGGEDWVEKILSVESVDIVRYPATTKGLFESEMFGEGLRKDILSVLSDEELTDDQIKEKLRTLAANQEATSPDEDSSEEEGDQGEPESSEEETPVPAAAMEALTSRVSDLESQVMLWECLYVNGIDVMALSEDQHSQMVKTKTRKELETLIESFPKQARGQRPAMPPGRNGNGGTYKELREQFETELAFK